MKYRTRVHYTEEQKSLMWDRWQEGDNELPDLYRSTLHRLHQRLVELREDIGAITREVEQLVTQGTEY